MFFVKEKGRDEMKHKNCGQPMYTNKKGDQTWRDAVLEAFLRTEHKVYILAALYAFILKRNFTSSEQGSHLKMKGSKCIVLKTVKYILAKIQHATPFMSTE